MAFGVDDNLLANLLAGVSRGAMQVYTAKDMERQRKEEQKRQMEMLAERDRLQGARDLLNRQQRDKEREADYTFRRQETQSDREFRTNLRQQDVEAERIRERRDRGDKLDAEERNYNRAVRELEAGRITKRRDRENAFNDFTRRADYEAKLKAGGSKGKTQADPMSTESLWESWLKMDMDERSEKYKDNFGAYARKAREDFKGVKGEESQPGAATLGVNTPPPPPMTGHGGIDYYNHYVGMQTQPQPGDPSFNPADTIPAGPLPMYNIDQPGGLSGMEGIDITDIADPMLRLDPERNPEAMQAWQLLDRFDSGEQITPEEEQWLTEWLLNNGVLNTDARQ